MIQILLYTVNKILNRFSKKQCRKNSGKMHGMHGMHIKQTTNTWWF